MKYKITSTSRGYLCGKKYSPIDILIRQAAARYEEMGYGRINKDLPSISNPKWLECLDVVYEQSLEIVSSDQTAGGK